MHTTGVSSPDQRPYCEAMLTWTRSHVGVLAAAAVVLVVAMASSATATLMVTGKSIKNESVTTKDIKNGTLKAEDLSTDTRTALQGTAGAPGTPGAPAFIGSPCTVPSAGAGTITMQVAANG